MDARDDAVGPGVAGSPRACGGKAGTGGGPVVEVAGLGNFVTLIKAEAETVRFLVLFLVLFFVGVESWMRACASCHCCP